MAGFHDANGNIVICLDDDGQTPADEVNKLTEGYDVVYASYEKKMQASFRNFGSMVNSKMTEIMLGKPRDLVINSYLGMRRFVMEVRPFLPHLIGLQKSATGVKMIDTLPSLGFISPLPGLLLSTYLEPLKRLICLRYWLGDIPTSLLNILRKLE